jgi:UDP-4-amino-4,6-dideoxy-N-acetyl-beta-L-altrosamine N-acetyltransferase
MTEAFTLRAVTKQDLDALREWRNDPSIRPFMLTQHEITQPEHEAWFAAASADPARRLVIAEQDAAPFGYVQFSGVAENGVADWGFYTRPGAPKGSGKKLGKLALDFAFDELALHKVRGQALAFNSASIAMHQKLGFAEEGLFREEYLIEGVWRDLVCFGLLRDMWRSNGTDND